MRINLSTLLYVTSWKLRHIWGRGLAKVTQVVSSEAEPEPGSGAPSQGQVSRVGLSSEKQKADVILLSKHHSGYPAVHFLNFCLFVLIFY